MLIRFMRAAWLRAPEDGGKGGAPTSPPPPTSPPAPPASAPDARSLLDLADAKAPPDATPKGHPATKDNPPAGGDPAAPAKPQRPDYVPEPFWDEEKGEVRVEQLAKSWRDTRDALNKGTKPPLKAEDYKLPLPEGAPVDLVKADDPLLKSIREAAHKAGVSQAQLDAIAGPYLAAAAELLAKQPAKPTPEQQAAAAREYQVAELKKLGNTGQAMVTAIGTWGKGLVDRGVLSQSEFAEFRRAADSADGIRMLAKLRDLSGAPPMPIDTAVIPDVGSLEDVYKLNASGKPEDLEKARRILLALEKQGLLPDRPPPGIGIGRGGA